MSPKLVNSSSTTPIARAERLKRLRNLANLSRREMCIDDDLKLKTYKNWELACYGGLTDKGARKVIKRVMAQGVVCTFDWLYFGLGEEPRHTTMEVEAPIITEREEDFVEEILFFKERHKNAIDYMVRDNTMAPLYKLGDCVAGILRSGKKIKDLMDHDCIVQTAGGDTLFRKLREGTEKDRYNLWCINLNTENKQPVLYNVKIMNAAPIIWHRRKDPHVR